MNDRLNPHVTEWLERFPNEHAACNALALMRRIGAGALDSITLRLISIDRDPETALDDI